MNDDERKGIERALGMDPATAQVLVLLAIEQRLDEMADGLASLCAILTSRS